MTTSGKDAHSKALENSGKKKGERESNSYVAAWIGEEFEGEWIHVYIRLSPFTLYLKLSQHY